MDSLSVEILLLIFEEFNLEEQIQCMLVCKKWANVLLSQYDTTEVEFNFECNILGASESFLLTLPPLDSPSDVRHKSLLEKVDNSTGYGSKCRELDMNYMNYILADYVALSKHFPDVTTFRLMSDNEQLPQSRMPFTPGQCLQLQSWRNKLEFMDIYIGRKDFLYFIDSGVFKSLKTLHIEFSKYCEFDAFPEFVARLENIPYLTELAIDNAIDIWDLELMHKKLLKLMSLELLYDLLSKKEVPLDVQPLKNLNKLTLNSGFICETLDCTLYLVLKYNNIKHFICSDYCDYDDFETLERDESNISQFLPLIGHRLKTLDFDSRYGSNILSSLQLSDLEVLKANLTLSEWTLDSVILPRDRLLNVRVLDLCQVPHFVYSNFSELTELVEIRLSFQETRKPKFLIALDTALDYCFPKKLKTLKLLYVEIVIASKDRLPFDSGIKKLKLSKCEVSEKLPNYLACHMKELDSFSFLESVIMPKTRTEDSAWRELLDNSHQHLFKLPNHHLSFAKFRLQERNMYRVVSLKYPKDFILPVKLQLSIGNNTRFYEVVEPFGAKEITELKASDKKKEYFHFKCSSIKNVVYNEHSIL